MDTHMDTQLSTSRRSGVALGLGTAFALSCSMSAAQLIDDAKGHEKNFAETSGPLIVGVLLLLVAAAIGFALRRASAGTAAAGAIVLAVLAWLSMIAWWVAAPAYLGVAAAWVAGVLDREAPPSRGAARTAGIVALFAVAANIILVVGALALTIF